MFPWVSLGGRGDFSSLHGVVMEPTAKVQFDEASLGSTVVITCNYLRIRAVIQTPEVLSFEIVPHLRMGNLLHVFISSFTYSVFLLLLAPGVVASFVWVSAGRCS